MKYTKENPEILSEEEFDKRFKMVYLENDHCANDGYHDSVDSAVCHYIQNCVDTSIDDDIVIYGTFERCIEIKADWIVENACEDLHEDAYDQCDVKGLQELLDKWCAEQVGATSYYRDKTVKVKLDIEAWKQVFEDAQR